MVFGVPNHDIAWVFQSCDDARPLRAHAGPPIV
jgi:hypothetical protein